METADLIKKVRKIEIKTKGLSNQVFAGEYHSAFKGRGMSFSEVRSYQYGDDVRNIDWNVTARTGDPHIKVFEEERELTMMLLVDISRSAYFGTYEQFKQEIITEICAVLSFSAIQNNDKVGVLFFTDTVEKYIPPKKGKSHILRIIRELLQLEPTSQKTSINAGLEFFNNVLKKRSICFLLSDFIDDTSFKNNLKIASRRHDIIGFHVYDPFEASLPNVGLMEVSDAETGQRIILDTGDARVRQHYHDLFETRKLRTADLFKRSGADIVHLSTNESYVHALHKFFKQRAKS